MILAVIPARIGSTRLPRKALADVAGRPLILRTLDAVRRARVDRLVVATDDEQIAAVVRGDGAEVVVTGPCDSGTMRVAEAARRLGVTAGVVINVQGDEPLLDFRAVDRVGEAVRPSTPIATAAAPFAGDATDTARVKVVADRAGRALYFSRSPIPHGGPYRLHLGIYAFEAAALAQVAALPTSPLETSERLEQLRWLDAGLPIQVVDVGDAEGGVDTPADLERVRNHFNRMRP